MSETNVFRCNIIGGRLPTESYRVCRADLIRYAGASNDFNPIHWSDHAARAAGLPDVIAHGMFLMALAARAVTGWLGAESELLSFDARFSRPLAVPDDPKGVVILVEGKIIESLPRDRNRILATVRACDGTVLVRCGAVVRAGRD